MRNIQLVTGLPFSIPPIEDITDDLQKKQSWETLPNKKYTHKGVWDGTYHKGLRKPEDITTIVVHHSASPEGTLEAHAGSHSRNWGAGIGYHIAINNGRIYQVNDLLTFSFHCGDNNTYTVGIEVNRDLSKSELTSQERELLYGAILTVKSLLPITEILGHNELNATACPCTSMNQIREDIAKLEIQIEINRRMETDGRNIQRKCLKATDQHVYLYNTYASDKVKYAWLEPKLLELYDVMNEKGLFFGSE